MSTPCPFCNLPAERISSENTSAFAIRDGFPVSPGHTLIIPKRHVGSFFDATTEERGALLSLLDQERAALELEFHPAGYNIGINDGPAAGQTVPHLHIHLIPRYPGDRPDPRGGIRWVLPEKADYWSPQSLRDSASFPRYLLHSAPDEKLRFIANIERVLAEGAFVSTYKYALLVSLVDLAIEHGDDSGNPLQLPIELIAEKFAELYWRQAEPYCATDDGAPGLLLHQNQGKQAAAIRLLAQLHASCSTISEARRSTRWRSLVSQMRSLLREMPLGRLQKLAHEEVVFLYEWQPKRDWITLLPGVAFHLRERATLIRRLAQTEWLRFVLSLQQNRPALGGATRLSEFLFGSSRAALAVKVCEPLRELQHGRCFYCEGGLRRDADVDHFIPWSRYPRDLIHNLVAAHAKCNADKSDLLGGPRYLERWARFISDEDKTLVQVGKEAGLIVDRPTSIAVTRWSYENIDRARSPVWLGRKQYGQLEHDWRGALSGL